jgi:hypothetical protein
MPWKKRKVVARFVISGVEESLFVHPGSAVCWFGFFWADDVEGVGFVASEPGLTFY